MHRPSWLAVELRTRLLRRGTRRRRSVNRARSGLRRDHATLRNNRLPGRGLGRCCPRSRRGGRLCRSWRSGRFFCRSSRRRRRFGRRRNHHGRRLLCLGRRRSHHYGRRRSGFFWLSLLHWRSGRRRRSNNRRSLARSRNNYGPFGRGRLDNRLFRCRSRRRRSGYRRRRRFGRSCRRRFHHRCRPGRHRRMLVLLLFLLQQAHHIARLGDLGEIELRLDLRRSGSFPGGRAGLGSKVLPDFFSFIGLNRA